MKKKLLNFSKNLIIILGLVVMMILFFTTRSYAASQTALGQLMRQTIGSWYRVIWKFSLSIFAIGYLLICMKLFTDNTPDKLKTIKESLGRFLLTFTILWFLHYIMIFIIMINEEGIKVAQNVGISIAGLSSNPDARLEYDLYETALSKAYEIAAVPGFVGLLMYILLVYYTYKFAFVYIRRFINVIVLILIGPVLIVVSTIKKIVTGISDNKIGKWFKEFIFNVIIQTFHAIFYGILIGFVLKLSDNDENLIGSLLALIIFGFIFKIDAIIRKLFNFVGGSTSIRGSKTLSVMSDALENSEVLFGEVKGVATEFGKNMEGTATKVGKNVKGAFTEFGKNVKEEGFGSAWKKDWDNTKADVKNGLNAIGERSVVVGFAKNVKEEGFGSALKEDWDNTKADVKNGLNAIGEKSADIGANIGGYVNQKFNDVKSEFTVDNAKAKIKDINEIMSGERVKDNLTSDEIVKEYHNINNPRGLEKVRQGVQSKVLNAKSKVLNVKLAVVGGVNNIKRIGKYSEESLKRIYNGSREFTKRKILEINQECNNMIEDVSNNIETVKRLSSILRKNNKKKKYIKNADGLNMDVSNAMMLVVDTDVDPREIIEQLKEEYGDNIDATAFVFNNVGAQAFLSEEVGSSRLGLSVLAEDNYENVAEHKIDDLVGEKRPKIGERRKIKKPTNMSSKKAVEKAAKTVEKSEKTNKVYKFSRFTPDTARKITNRLLKKSRKQNRYLIVLTKTYEDIQLGRLKCSGNIVKTDSKDINHEIKMTRSQFSKSIRNIKLSQQASVVNYKEQVRKTRRIEMANEIADKAMTARNVINLGFKRIDNMTPGQIGLRRMIQSGLAYQVANDLVMVRRDNIEAKIKATGIFKPEENQVVQFVISEDGKLIPQIVTIDGKIVQPAINELGEMVGMSEASHIDELEEVIGMPKVHSIEEPEVEIKNLLEQFLTITNSYVGDIQNEENSVLDVNQSNEQIVNVLQQIILISQDYVNQPEELNENVFSEKSESQQQESDLLIQFLNVAQEYINEVNEPQDTNLKTINKPEVVNELQENIVDKTEVVNEAQENIVDKTEVVNEAQEVTVTKDKSLELLKQLLVTSENYIEQINFEEQAQEVNGNQGTLEERKLKEQQQIIEQRNLFKPKEETHDSKEVEAQIEKEETIQQIENIEPESEKSLDKVVQRIVNLEGTIVEQVVNSDNTIETERYNILNVDNNDDLVKQIGEVVSSEDLGLPEDAPMEVRVQKFEDLLQDLNTQPLLEQVLEAEPEEENELDEIIIDSALKTNAKDLKYLDYDSDNDAREFAVREMVSKGIIKSEEVENDDVVGNAIDILNDRVQTLSSDKNDILLDKVAEREYIKFVEESINLEGFNRENHPSVDEVVNIEEKTEELSDLLMNLAKEYIKPTIEVPISIVDETIDATKEVFANAKNGVKTPEQIAQEKAEKEAEKLYKKEIEKAEKKWAKRNNQKSEKNVYEKIKKQGEESSAEELTKITLKFFGNVKNQGQSITLSNRHSIKDFYDKVDKLDGSDLVKTQERFLQVNGGKLKELQLLPFSFSKCPVSLMDGWSIYVVSNKEDITEGEKEREIIKETVEENLVEEIEEPINESIQKLINRYFYELKEVFIKFVKEKDIDSFDKVNKNQEELQRKVRKILLRRDESDCDDKATKIVGELHKDKRFRKLLGELNKEKSEENSKNITKKFAINKVKQAKGRVKFESREEAEKEASKRITEEEVENDKKLEKERFAEQVFDEMNKQMVNSDIQNLLEQLNENKVYIEVGEKRRKNSDIMRFQY